MRAFIHLLFVTQLRLARIITQYLPGDENHHALLLCVRVKLRGVAWRGASGRTDDWMVDSTSNANERTGRGL